MCLLKSKVALLEKVCENLYTKFYNGLNRFVGYKNFFVHVKNRDFTEKQHLLFTLVKNEEGFRSTF